nr:glycosyltransferase [Rubritepida sp.]
ETLDFLRGVEATPRVAVLWSGRREGPERAALEAQGAALGIAPVTRFLGHVPDPAAAYRALDLFALSSDTEQMPFSVLEAMGSGLAVASTDVGDVRVMLAPENAALVTGRDEAALAAGLRTLLADAARRARLGAANRARAEAEFDEALMARRHAALWRGEALP